MIIIHEDYYIPSRKTSSIRDTIPLRAGGFTDEGRHEKKILNRDMTSIA